MISDLDRPETVRDRPRPWLLPAVTAACVAAFIAAGAFVARETPAGQGAAVAQPSAATPSGAWEITTFAPVPLGGSLQPSRQVREVVLPERPSRISALALPASAYKSVARVAGSVTTGLLPADEEALVQLRYRLLDDRVVVLVRLPWTDPLRGVEPTRYTADTVFVRGIEARVLSGRSAVEPTILLWTEAGRSYQLYSSVLSTPELLRVAEQLR